MPDETEEGMSRTAAGPMGWSEGSATVGEMKERVVRFLRERDWERFHSPKNVAMSVAIEAGELLEIFQWVASERADAHVREHPEVLEHVTEEVADVVIYCLSLSHRLGFDLAAAIDRKIAKNALKYPAPLGQAVD